MPKHSMRPEDLLLLRWPSDPRLSPDGSQVAWTEVSLDAERDEPVSCVMVGAADGSGAPRRFSNGPHDFSAQWSPDGRHLAYLAAENAPPALKLAPLNGGLPVTVEAPGPVKQFAWSPTGDRLVLVVNVGGRTPSDNPKEQNAPRLIRGLFNRLDGAGWIEGRDHLVVHDVERQTTTTISGGDYDHASPAFSPDGTTIAFVSDRSRQRDHHFGEADLWTIPAAGGRKAPTRVAGDLAEPGYVSYSPDGSHIAFTGLVGTDQVFGRDMRLHVVAADGSGPPETMVPGVDRPVCMSLGPTPYAWVGLDEIAFVVWDHGAVHLRSAQIGDRTARMVLGGDRVVAGLSVPAVAAPRESARKGRTSGGPKAFTAPARIAFTSAWFDSPQEVYTLELGRRGRQPVQVSAAGDEMRAAVTLLPAERYRATAPDGLEIEYFAMRPKRSGRSANDDRAPGGPPPLVLEIHGGPSLNHPFAETIPNYQAIAAAGYTLLLPNPRGSTSYGEKFTAMARGDWGDTPLGDVLACADDAVARGLADESRQFVSGYSYGGYLSSFAIGRTRRFKAAAIGAPVTDLVSMYGSSDASVFFGDALNGDPWKTPEAFRHQSPVAHADKAKTPVFLFVNDGDLRCPPGQADELYSALVSHGVEVEYARYPGGSHLAFLPIAGPPSQNIDRMERILGWFGRHGGVPTG